MTADFSDSDEQLYQSNENSNAVTYKKVLPPDTLVSKEVHKFLQPQDDYQKSLLNFAKNHDKLSEQIQEEILQNTIQALDETDLQNDANPFFDENNLIQKLKNISPKKLISSIQQIQQQLQDTETGKENLTNFEFYKNEFEKIEKILEQKDQAENFTLKKIIFKKEEETNERLEILARNLKQDLEKSLQERYIAWQLKEIDKKRKKYLEEFYKKIEQFKKLKDKLSPIIKEFQDLLENDSALQELADLVGRQAEEKKI